MDVKVAQLKSTAEEMNKLMNLNPPIKVHFAKTEALIAEIVFNAIGDDGKGGIIEEDGVQEADAFTLDTHETLKAILTPGTAGHDRVIAICDAAIAAAPPREEKTAEKGKKAGKATKGATKEKSTTKKEAVAKGPGVLSVIQELIVGATKAKPVTKEQIVTELVARFPDRNADSMKNTVNIQVPSRMAKEKSLNIVKHEGGFYVEK